MGILLCAASLELSFLLASGSSTHAEAGPHPPRPPSEGTVTRHAPRSPWQRRCGANPSRCPRWPSKAVPWGTAAAIRQPTLQGQPSPAPPPPPRPCSTHRHRLQWSVGTAGVTAFRKASCVCVCVFFPPLIKKHISGCGEAYSVIPHDRLGLHRTTLAPLVFLCLSSFSCRNLRRRMFQRVGPRVGPRWPEVPAPPPLEG